MRKPKSKRVGITLNYIIMKTGILLLSAILSFASVNANNIEKTTSKIGVENRYDDAVTFIEKGIEFHVFLNGDFDFNIRYKNSKYIDYNGRRIKFNKKVRINRDRRGRIKRIGNTTINYNYKGDVKRIGNVFIDYRFNQVVRVGDLKVKYNRWGNPHFYGDVKHNDYHYNNNRFNITVFDYNNNYFYNRKFKNNYRKYKEDNHFYYYRALPNAKVGKHGKMIKRRKNKKYKKYDVKTEQKGKSRRRH